MSQINIMFEHAAYCKVSCSNLYLPYYTKRKLASKYFSRWRRSITLSFLDSCLPTCGDEYSKKYNLSLFAYCLMDNYVHFIAIPRKEESLAKVFSITHMRYSQYFNNNKKKNTSGHLWQGRFYSCVLDKPHLLVALRYMEKNPVRAGIVEKAWQWKWSSATAHINRSTGTIWVSCKEGIKRDSRRDVKTLFKKTMRENMAKKT